MSSLPGTWTLTMRTPVGSINAEMSFAREGDHFQGIAMGTETVTLRDIRTQPLPAGERVRWSQSITKPMRLNLDFDVVIEGDEMRGFSRAGRLPKSAVLGRRLRVTESDR